jgi:hypothetical protein
MPVPSPVFVWAKTPSGLPIPLAVIARGALPAKLDTRQCSQQFLPQKAERFTMSKPTEPEVISRRKLFLLAGLAASFAVPASVITASNADAQQPEAQQPSAPPKKKKKKRKKKKKEAPAGAAPAPSPSEAPKAQ